MCVFIAYQEHARKKERTTRTLKTVTLEDHHNANKSWVIIHYVSAVWPKPLIHAFLLFSFVKYYIDQTVTI